MCLCVTGQSWLKLLITILYNMYNCISIWKLHNCGWTDFGGAQGCCDHTRGLTLVDLEGAVITHVD